MNLKKFCWLVDVGGTFSSDIKSVWIKPSNDSGWREGNYDTFKWASKILNPSFQGNAKKNGNNSSKFGVPRPNNNCGQVNYSDQTPRNCLILTCNRVPTISSKEEKKINGWIDALKILLITYALKPPESIIIIY
jgi:hypothetical protein